MEAQTLNDLKKYFEEEKNKQNTQGSKIQELLLFKEKIFKHFAHILSESRLGSKDKISLLELLERELISTKYNSNLFTILYNCLIHDDENVAIQASKAIDVLIKQIN